MSFRLRIDYDGEPIAKVKANKIDGFDNLMKRQTGWTGFLGFSG